VTSTGQTLLYNDKRHNVFHAVTVDSSIDSWHSPEDDYCIGASVELHCQSFHRRRQTAVAFDSLCIGNGVAKT